MKNIVVGLILLSSFFFKADAQTRATYSSNNNGVAIIQETLYNNNQIEGSTFLFKEWTNSGKIYMDNGGIVDIDNINFNVQDAMFSSKMSNDSIFTFYKIYKVEVDGKLFERFNGKFYQNLYTTNNKQVLLKDYSVEIKPELHYITNTVIGPGKYVIQDKYYTYAENDFKKLTLSKKDVMKRLISKKSLVLKYVKDNKLSFSKEEDVIKIFKYYDAL